MLSLMEIYLPSALLLSEAAAFCPRDTSAMTSRKFGATTSADVGDRLGPESACVAIKI